MLAACRRGGNSGPTLQPSPTATPRSTALPTLQPTLAPGSADNPVRVLFVARPDAQSQNVLNRAGDDLTTALAEVSGLQVSIEVVEDDAGAVAALCEGRVGQPIAAWTTGLGYASATALNCGAPLLQVERTVDGQTRAGEVVQFIANRDVGISGVSALNGYRLCRLSLTDFYTWLVPSLLLQSEGVSPASDITEIAEAENLDDVVDAVAAGECDAAAMRASDYEALASGDTLQSTVALTPSVEVPYSLLLTPNELPLGTRTALRDAFLTLAGDENEALQDLLEFDSVTAVDDDDMNDFDAFVGRTGLAEQLAP